MPKKIIFFGLGSIAKKHINVIRDCYDHELFAFRSGLGSYDTERGVKNIYSWKEIGEISPDIAFITNPTNLHVQTALKCAEKGMALFIEKPLDADERDLDRLLDMVSRKRIATYVSYVLRFHPVIKKLKAYADKNRVAHARVVCSSYLPEWRAGGRDHYSSYKNMGGGVILDLSHELDYVDHIMGGINTIAGEFSRSGNVTVDSEDYADILVVSRKGPVNIHINFLSRIKERTIKMDLPDMSLEGDLLDFSLTKFTGKTEPSIISFKKDLGDLYAEQIKYFFSNLDNTKMENNIFEASKLFRKMIKFKKSKGHNG